MKNKLFLIVLAVCMLAFFAACTTFTASGFQVGMSTSGTEVLGDFSTTVRVHKFLGTSGGINLFNLSSNATNGPIRDVIDKEIQKKGGTAAINISVRYRASFIQKILNNITLKIWAPARVTIKGTVIRQN